MHPAYLLAALAALTNAGLAMSIENRNAMAVPDVDIESRDAMAFPGMDIENRDAMTARQVDAEDDEEANAETAVSAYIRTSLPCSPIRVQIPR
jgi:hypothetical protein